MEQKAKLIIIGLIIVTVASFALLVQVSGAKQQVTRERDELKVENSKISANLDKLKNSIRSYESRITTLTSDLESANQQKADLEKRYELVNRAREDLIQKLKEQQQKRPEAQEERREETVVPQTSDAYWADVLKAKSDLELQLTNVRTELKSLQIANEQLQREKSNFELDITNLKREKEDLKRQIEYNQKMLDSISKDLVREKNDKTQIQDTYKLIKNENATLSRQLQNLNNRKITLDKKIQDLQDNKALLERRLSEMETMLTDKVNQVDDFKDKVEAIKTGAAVPAAADKKEAVELAAIVVRPQAEKPRSVNPDIGFIGKVLAVNRDNNFVIIDLGQDAGLKIGDAFKIYRDEKPVASIEVTQVRRGISACDIKKEMSPVKIGDVVR
jgi:chromosome segregation ATPase